MDDMNGSELDTGKKTPGIAMWIAIALIITQAVIMLALYLSRPSGQGAKYETVLGNTAKAIEMVSRIRINLLKSTDLMKNAVMAVTDEESQAFARQSRESADAVEQDYRELTGLIDAARIDNEMKLLKEFGDNWNQMRLVDKEILSLAVENSNIKAAHLSSTAAARAITDFEGLLSRLMDLPASDGERAQAAKRAYEAVIAAFRIYSLEAPHINEARDKKMDELEKVMGENEKKVQSALHDLSGLTSPQGEIVLKDALSTFAKFMKVHREVLRLSRMNTNIKSLELSLGRKRKVAAQCEEILNSLQDAVQDRSFKATK